MGLSFTARLTAAEVGLILKKTVNNQQEVTMERVIEIKHHHTSYSSTVDHIDFNDIKSLDNAYPTSRVLDGSEDQGYSEEWEEPARLPDGKTGCIVYLFDAEDIANVDAESYPWDYNHVKCFVLDPD